MANKDELFFLPEDIIVNILKRLLVKSLLRFRCVCKDWNNLFKTSSFIKQHFYYSSPSLLLQSRCLTFFTNNMPCFLLDSDKNTLVPLNAPRSLFYKDGVIGSSYGLLCLLSNFDLSLFLWNPATREVQHVPDSTNNYGNTWSAGFGFSTVVNDYKIVKIYELKSSRENHVEIYSLSTGSWKEVVEFGNFFESTGFICFERKFTVTDRAMYFFAHKKVGDQRFIVSFDMAKEVFALIAVPSPNFLVKKKLITYENKLALLSHNELWVMEEKATPSGSRQIWNKELISSTWSPHLHPMTIWRDEAVLGQIHPNLEIFIYLSNLSTGKLKELSIDREAGYTLGAFNYAESIASIGNKASKT